MTTVWLALAGYFGLGVIALAIFELCTKRISKKLREASADAQLKLLDRGTVVGSRVATALVVLTMWLFWVIVIYSAILSSSIKMWGKDGT